MAFTQRALAPKDFIGIHIFAQTNVFMLSFYGKRVRGKEIVFEAQARDNTVFAFNLPNVLTSRDTHPMNRDMLSWVVGFDVITRPPPPSGEAVVNINPYNVEVF